MKLRITNRTLPRYAGLVSLLSLLLLSLFSPPKATALRPAFRLENGNPDPVISVSAKKNPAVYDTVENPEKNLEIHFGIQGQCPEEKYRLKSASLKIGSNVFDIPVNHDHRSIGPDHGNWPEYDMRMVPNANLDMTTYYKFFAPSYKPRSSSPAEACNAELENLVKKGASRESVLQHGFEFWAMKVFKGELGVSCESSRKIGYAPERHYYASNFLDVRIRCLPTDYVKPSRAKVEPTRTKVPDPPISSVVVAADPRVTAGRQCPVYVNFRGRITADEKSEYSTLNTKYRFLGDNGYETEWIRVAVPRGAPRSINGRRFIEAPKINPAGTFKTPGGTAKIPRYNGWMMAEVMLPNGGVRRSEKSEFVVDCNAQPLPGTIKSKP